MNYQKYYFDLINYQFLMGEISPQDNLFLIAA